MKEETAIDQDLNTTKNIVENIIDAITCDLNFIFLIILQYLREDEAGSINLWVTPFG